MCSSILLPADIMDQTKGQFLRKGEHRGAPSQHLGESLLSGVLPHEDSQSCLGELYHSPFGSEEQSLYNHRIMG